MTIIVNKIRNASATFAHWVSLKETIQQFVALRELETKQNNNFSLTYLKEITNIWTESITQINRIINSTIDFALSYSDRRIRIHSGVCDELDRYRRLEQDIPHILHGEAEKLRCTINNASIIDSLEVAYYPNLGYLVGIAQQPNECVPEGWSFHFCDTDNHCFFKSERMFELDEELGDIIGMMNDLEAAVVRRLGLHVLEVETPLKQLCRYSAELDCRLSLARAAIELHLVRPRMTTENTLQIEQGFHLLQQSYCVDNFIPNDTHIASTNHSDGAIHLLNGPNSSGKSVYLKQVGIIVYLAHCGSFVPANSALIGITDRILTRMDSSETAIGSLSTFVRDCSQLSFLQKHVTPHSLVLVDEFGKGTCKQDGIALLSAFINHWTNRPLQECPKIIGESSSR